MKSSLSRSLMYLAVSSASLILTACGGDSSSDSNSNEEHEHEHTGRLLMSDDTTTLTVYDQSESAFETLQSSASLAAPALLLADNGLSAAVVNTSSVQFVHSGLHAEEDEEEESEEEHEHEDASLIDLSISGTVSKVITSHGHFSVLIDGGTQLVPADDIESVTTADIESFDTVTQTYPALVLDEETETLLVFSNDTATVYSGNTATSVSTDCTNPAWHVESEHLTLFGCDEGTLYMSLEGNFTEFGTLTLPDGVTVWPENWISNGDAIVGYSTDVVIAIEEDESTETFSATDVTSVLTADNSIGNICAAGFATEDTESIGFVSDDAYIYVINMEDDSVTQLALSQSEAGSLSCSDLHLTTAASGFPIIDESVSKLYLFDAHDGSAYHLHSTIDLDSNIGDVTAAVFMHAIESEAHQH